MARPIRGGAWLQKRGDRWYRFWYDEVRQETCRVSLKTKDEATARQMLDAFLRGAPNDAPVGVWLKWAMRMCKRARENAKQKGRGYSLTPELVAKMLEAQEYRCAVTGVQLDHEYKYRNPFAPSLDQIKPGAGYHPSNIRIVAMIVNTAMNGWGEEPLFRLLREAAHGPRFRPAVGETSVERTRPTAKTP